MKSLIGATFLSLLAATAQAAGWNYGIEGHAQGLYGYTDIQKHNHGTGKGYIDSYAEYAFDSQTTAALYLSLNGGIDRELQDYNQGRWGEEVYGDFDSAYGRVMLGQTYNVAALFHQGAPSVGALSSNSDVVDFLANPNWRRTTKETKFATLTSTDINTDGVAEKINYISPEFSGMAFGLSYIPDSYNRRGLISKYADYAHDDGFVGAVYADGDWGWFNSKSAIGYAQYHGNDKEWSYSLNLSRGNWNIGGGFRKTYIDGDDKSTPKKELAPDFDGYREGQAWNIGVGFDFGPFSSALTYFDSKSDRLDNHDKIVAFSNQYSFNKYTDFYVAAAYGKYRATEQSVEGYALVTGVGVNF
jgi:predicted porin